MTGPAKLIGRVVLTLAAAGGAAAWSFYTATLGIETVADYGFAKILPSVPGTELRSYEA